MLKKILIPFFVILLVGMIAFLLWPPNKPKKISSIKDALTQSLHVQCEYTDEAGLITKTYTKNGMLRSSFKDKNDDQNSGGVLIRDGKSYVWWDKDKQGVFLSSAADNSEQKNQIIRDIEQYKDTCKSTDVSDTLFAIPSEIHFRDILKKPTPTDEPTE